MPEVKPRILRLSPGSRLWIEGDSTLHRFKSESTDLRATFGGAPEGDLESLIRTGAIACVEVSVPVRSLKSGEAGLDDNLWKELQASRHPFIVFRLDSYDVAPGTLTLQLHGRLNVAGVERRTDVDAIAERSPTGVRVTGRAALAMSDYGVRPPVLMFGVLKVKDAVVVRFELELVRS